MKYCKVCGQNVEPVKKFSIPFFLINCLWLVGGIVYVIYYIFMKKKTCPICGGEQLEQAHSRDEANGTTLTREETWKIESDAQKLKLAQTKDRYAQEITDAKAKNAEAKAAVAETMRKKKAGELPYQIKAAEKKAAKLSKKVG